MSRFNGAKIGCIAGVLFVMAAISSPAQTLTVLTNFNGTDGYWPSSALVQGTDGNFCGTTQTGGNPACMDGGCGTIFKITPADRLTTLYSFSGADGYYPQAGLVQGADGNFYGATNGGGAYNGGTAFKITARGTLTTLHDFSQTDGEEPNTLIQASDGNFYGTTKFYGGGGQSGCCGTIFKMTPAGAVTTLHVFLGTDGGESTSALVQGNDGNFYGTTEGGGYFGDGTAFKITPQGAFTSLHSFRTTTDGQYLWGGLVQALDGNFYGATEYGGAYGWGTLFRITPRGAVTTLHSFDYVNDGREPVATMVLGSDGNLYGTTQGGVSYNTFGTIFQLTTGGSLTTLHIFDAADGMFPNQLIQDTDGNFYGSTFVGGAHNDGTAYGFATGLGPFVATQPNLGRVGTVVRILGTNLSGATGVTFNGIAATFRVVSNALITAAVPAGATTGYVQVTTPGGTLTSNVPFRVH